jgi:hypothetical protein
MTLARDKHPNAASTSYLTLLFQVNESGENRELDLGPISDAFTIKLAGLDEPRVHSQASGHCAEQSGQGMRAARG